MSKYRIILPVFEEVRQLAVLKQMLKNGIQHCIAYPFVTTFVKICQSLLDFDEYGARNCLIFPKCRNPLNKIVTGNVPRIYPLRIWILFNAPNKMGNDKPVIILKTQLRCNVLSAIKITDHCKYASLHLYISRVHPIENLFPRNLTRQCRIVAAKRGANQLDSCVN